MPLQFQPLTPKEFFASCNKDYAESKISELEEFKEKVAQYLESLDKHKKAKRKSHCRKCSCTLFARFGIPSAGCLQTQGQQRN